MLQLGQHLLGNWKLKLCLHGLIGFLDARTRSLQVARRLCHNAGVEYDGICLSDRMVCHCARMQLLEVKGASHLDAFGCFCLDAVQKVPEVRC
jgi:hypothetical protein